MLLMCAAPVICPYDGPADADFHRQPFGVGDEGGGPQAGRGEGRCGKKELSAVPFAFILVSFCDVVHLFLSFFLSFS